MTRAHGPDPATIHPLEMTDQVAFLAPLIGARKHIEIGRFTYYDDPAGPDRFFDRCIRYHFEFTGDWLRIGPFCAIARDAQFIMNGANHGLTGLSTYPFGIFGKGWTLGDEDWASGSKGDTVIGPDVWIGTEAMILPGVTIGAGAVIAARAVVARDVPPYAVVAGNPAQVIRQRVPDDVAERMLALAWWDWPPERITAAIPALRSGDIAALEALA